MLKDGALLTSVAMFGSIVQRARRPNGISRRSIRWRSRLSNCCAGAGTESLSSGSVRVGKRASSREQN
jgi:hypothetical protein